MQSRTVRVGPPAAFLAGSPISCSVEAERLDDGAQAIMGHQVDPAGMHVDEPGSQIDYQRLETQSPLVRSRHTQEVRPPCRVGRILTSALCRKGVGLEKEKRAALASRRPSVRR